VFNIAMVSVACSKEDAASKDAMPSEDARVPDSGGDAPPDAPPDAGPPAASTCAATASILVDVAPSRVGQIARVGDTLYVAAYDYDNADLNPRVLAYDLTTGTPSASPFFLTQIRPQLWPGDGEVWVSDYSAGSIWRLRPGMNPEEVVTARPKPGAVTAEGGYVYWGETEPPSNEQSVIRRRLITGGAVETVTTCNAIDLVVVGDDLYCADFLHGIKRAPKSGGNAVSISSPSSYPIPSFTRDGNDLFFVTLKPTAEIYRLPIPNGPASLVTELTTPSRYSGIAASSQFIYLTGDGGVRRIHRPTNLLETSYSGTLCAEDPVLWNGQIVFVKKDAQVLRCVD
jgi:hypothetical protein